VTREGNVAKKQLIESGADSGKSFKASTPFTANIEHVEISKLRLPDRQLRIHPKRQTQTLANLIREYGFVSPIIVDNDNVVIAGVARVMAAQLLGLETVPMIRVLHLTEPQVRAFRIADNKLSEMSKWDPLSLSLELIELQELNIELSSTGFVPAELDLLTDQQLASNSPVIGDDCPPVDLENPPSAYALTPTSSSRPKWRSPDRRWRLGPEVAKIP
jgi:hypothetical protein